MKERPILFNDEMLRAILEGRKTQTRRVVPDRLVDKYSDYDDWCNAVMPRDIPCTREYESDFYVRRCQLGQVGDRMYVREAWQYYDWTDDGYPMIRYRADGATEWKDIPEDVCEGIHENIWAKLSEPENYKIDGAARDRKWRPSIHMPRWASRITLEITGVRVERLNDISDDDAWDEGIDQTEALSLGTTKDAARAVFSALWESIYGHESWNANPWVWVIEFKLVTS